VIVTETRDRVLIAGRSAFEAVFFGILKVQENAPGDVPIRSVLDRRAFFGTLAGGLLAVPLATEGRPKRAGSLARRFRYNRAAAMQGTWVPLARDRSVSRSLPESQGRQVGKEDI